MPAVKIKYEPDAEHPEGQEITVNFGIAENARIFAQRQRKLPFVVSAEVEGAADVSRK